MIGEFKIVVVFLFGLSAIIACRNKNKIESTIVPEIDERVELMSILARIADYEEYSDSTYIGYVTQIEDYFGDFTNSKVVLTLKSLRDSTNLAYDGIMKMAVNLDISQNGIQPIENISDLDDRWPSKVAERFYKELNDFYNKSKFQKWFSLNKEMYQDILTKANEITEVDKDWFNDFFGYSNPQKFRLILGLGNGYGNYGPSSTNKNNITIYAIIGIGDVDETGEPIFYKDEILPTVVHEFLHSYINPFTSVNGSKLIRSGEDIYKATITEMNKLAYGDGETVINESLVRSCVIHYMIDNSFPNDEVIFEKIYNKKIGFYWIDELTDSLSSYKNNRMSYITFSDYTKNIANFFETIAIKSSSLKKGFENARATVIQTNPPLNGLISHETNEISFTLDQKLLKNYYGFGRVRNQKELYPEYSSEDNNFTYSNEDKTITIKNVTLSPNSTYRMKLIGNMTCTQDGNTSRNYELVFETK